MLFIYGDIFEGMVELVMEFVCICYEFDFYNIVILMKVLWVLVMFVVYCLMVDIMDKEGFNYLFYLGVIEVGDGDYGWIKSIVGIVILLVDGLGDMFWVLLMEVFEKEIFVCYLIF